MPDRLVCRPTRVKSLAALALALVASHAASAQVGDTRNAASWYAKGIDRLDMMPLSDAQWQALRGYQPHSGAPPSQDVRDALAQLRPAFSAIQRGSRQGYSDFDLDYSQGFDLVLPHLSKLRQLSSLMSKEAMVRLHDGDASGAAEAVAAIYRLSGHVGDDRVLISSLVGRAIFEQADLVVQSGLDMAAFGPVESSGLLAAVRPLGTDDPFDIVSALSNEQQMMVSWVREKYALAEDRAWMLDEMNLDVGAAGRVAGLMLLPETHFEAALDETDQVLQRVVDLFSLPDPVEARFELERLTEEIQRGEHGPLASLLVPNLVGIHKQMMEAATQIQERSAVLQAVVDGTLTPEALANAAVWYLRAVEMLKALPPEARARLLEVTANPNRPVDEEAIKALAQASKIIDTLRLASQKPRCDFSMARSGSTSAIAPYAGGLRESARLLHADAIRHLQQARPEQASQRLAIGYVLSAHLGEDRELVSSLTSHVIFGANDRLARWGLESFTPDQRSALLAAARKVSLRDPFGYRSSLAVARRQIIERLRLSTEARQHAQGSVAALDGDRLLFLLVVASPEEGPWPQGAELDDVLSGEGLTDARARAEQVQQLIAESGDLAVLEERPIADIGQVVVRSGKARETLRDALRTLEAKPVPAEQMDRTP